MSAQAKDFGKVAVLMGGWAAERPVSLVSGAAVLAGLQRCGVDAHGVDVGRDILDVIKAGGFDRVFNVVHGRGGEDGVIQGALDVLGVPYTGSGVLGSAIAMDKYRTKLIWQSLGIPTPGFAVIESEADLQAAAELGFPLMVKPAQEGSSIGMARATNLDELRSAWSAARKYDSAVLAEQWVSGTEYTVAILGEQALPLIRLQTANVFYDYQAKYESNETQYHVPCGLDAETETALQVLALRAYAAIGASGWGRVDLFLDAAQQPWLIEANTVPGMTDHSLVPMAAKAAGIDFDALVLRVLSQTLAVRHDG